MKAPTSPFSFLRKAHSDRTEAAVDVEDLAGDSGGKIGAKERGGVADIFLSDVAPERRHLSDPAQHLAKARDAGGGQRLDGAGGDGVDPHALRAEVRGQKAHIGLEAGLGE